MSAAGETPRGDEAKPLGVIARRLLRSKKFREKGKYGALSRAWAELVGAELAARTRVASLKNGTLAVEVDSSVLLHELDGFMKQELLTQFRAVEAGRDVARISFRLR
jgi:predicted nucleic acid-binding Zn ribbon protein